MSPQYLITILPDVGEAEAVELLAAELTRRRLRVIERLEHPDGDVHPALGRHLDGHPAQQAFSFFETPRVGREAPTTVIDQRFGGDGSWDPSFARRLSRASGGFALAMEQWRYRDEYGLGVFYAGRTAEALRWDHAHRPARPGPPGPSPHLDDDSTWPAFAAHYRAITGGFDRDVLLPAGVPKHSWIVSSPDAEPAEFDWDSWGVEAEAPPLRRAALIWTDAARVRAAVTALGTAGCTVRFLERRAPVSELTYVLIEDFADHTWIAALAHRLDCAVAAVDMLTPDSTLFWTIFENGRLRTGTARGATELARVYALTGMIGEPPAVIRWPPSSPGESIGPLAAVGAR